MITRWAQGAALLLVVANFCSGAVPEGKYARQLQTECRELIADAVSRPYGIAWGEAPAVVRGGTAARPVVMSHSASPA
ncbi:MAG TPA: hypothetical protein PLD59_16900, partial [Tepidisphaeraceae bacterium]|nr:hypothetical protein [Tepidisphaeraceae bacterium]